MEKESDALQRSDCRLRHTARQAERDPAAIPRLGPLPEGLPGAAPVLLAGRQPLALVSGEGRQLLAVLRAPLGKSDAGSWIASASFPLFWAELLELAAPRTRAELRAHPAGRPHPLLAEVPYALRTYRDAGGRALLGTVAAPLAPDPPAAERAFSQGDLERLEAARPEVPARTLAPWLALLALLPVLGAWWPLRAERGSIAPR